MPTAEIDDVIGNVIGNWLYDQIVQHDKKEAAIIERLERIEALLIQIAEDRIQQSRVSETVAREPPNSRERQPPHALSESRFALSPL